MAYLLTLLGFIVLLVGGEAIVRGSVALANRLRVAPFLIGLTIVGFGTSLPELFVSVNAALVGAPGLAVGNVIGSNIANILLIIGVAALITPILIKPAEVKSDTITMLVATALYTCFGLTTRIITWHGIILLGLLATYLYIAILRHRSNPALETTEAKEIVNNSFLFNNLYGIIFITLLGLVSIIIGAELLVAGATAVAKSFGVSEEVIGLTIIAIGTSVPELATAIVAAYRKQAEICIGNVLGSNIFNILSITGITALFSQLPFSSEILSFDLWIVLGCTLIFGWFLLNGHKITRIAGILFISTYTIFILAQFLT